MSDKYDKNITTTMLALHNAGIGNKTILHSLYNMPKKAVNPSYQFIKNTGIPQIDKFSKDDWKIQVDSAKKQMQKAKKLGIHMVNYADSNYPKNLRRMYNPNISNPPTMLYVKGNPKILNNKSVAVVGDRKLTNRAKSFTSGIASHYAEKGYTTIGGLADGADSLAAKASLANGGKNISIMAGGLDQGIYPKSNQPLAKKIVQNGGALVSTYPLGTKIKRNQFVQRDQWQAGMANGIIATQAGTKSGTRHTMTDAIKMHKPLAAPDYSKIAPNVLSQSGETDYDIKHHTAHPISTMDDVDDFDKEMQKDYHKKPVDRKFYTHINLNPQKEQHQVKQQTTKVMPKQKNTFTPAKNYWHGKANVYYLNNNNDLKKELIDYNMMPYRRGKSHYSRRYAQKISSNNLHKAFLQKHPKANPIEISSASNNSLGVKASAMNLDVDTSKGKFKVEQLYQAGKVFSGQTPQQHKQVADKILSSSPWKAKSILYKNVSRGSKMKDFQLYGHKFPTQPKNYFYDNLYLHGLEQHPNLVKQVNKHNAFTDVYAGKNVVNTQAKSCAMYSSLTHKYGNEKAQNIVNSPKKLKNIENKIDIKNSLPSIGNHQTKHLTHHIENQSNSLHAQPTQRQKPQQNAKITKQEQMQKAKQLQHWDRYF